MAQRAGRWVPSTSAREIRGAACGCFGYGGAMGRFLFPPRRHRLLHQSWQVVEQRHRLHGLRAPGSPLYRRRLRPGPAGPVDHRYVVAGSHNLNIASADSESELLLVLDAPEEAATLEGWLVEQEALPFHTATGSPPSWRTSTRQLEWLSQHWPSLRS